VAPSSDGVATNDALMLSQAEAVELENRDDRPARTIHMKGSVSILVAGLVFVFLLRPWRLPDQASREYSALIAAVLLGTVLAILCWPV
jgi:hypothetical protein